MRRAQIQNVTSQLSYHANMQPHLNRTKLYKVMVVVFTALVKFVVQNFKQLWCSHHAGKISRTRILTVLMHTPSVRTKI